MSVYGGSRLHRYVELIFRSKRLLILCVVIGTVVAGAVMGLRRDLYHTSMVIALFGDPTVAEASGESRDMRQGIMSETQRKVHRLDLWVRKDPEFLRESLRNEGLDTRHGAQFDTFVREVRSAVRIARELVGGQYLEVSMVWRDPVEAERILGSLYSRFADRTVSEETAVVTTRRLMLERQFRQYDARADELAQRKTSTYAQDWYRQPSLLPVYMSRWDQSQRQLLDTEMMLNEARVRMSQVDRMLAAEQQYVTDTIVEVTGNDDPTVALTTRRQELESQLAQLQTRYNVQHPLVRDTIRQMAALDQQIEEAKRSPVVRRTSETQRSRRINPQYQELQRQRATLALSVGGLTQRLASLRRDAEVAQDRVREIPGSRAVFERASRDYEMMDKVRNELRAQLVAAEIDEEREKTTQAALVKLMLPPRSERADSGARAMLLWTAGPLIGLLIALAFSLLAMAFDRTLRTPAEVETFLGKPVLAVIPKVAPGAADAARQLPGMSRPGIAP
ncbi:MAG TPA: hypothetical protein VLH79_08720 [Chthonomonadales bacterium]|nr:hypothetical protein [Chthonomonadales bacterium]